MGSEASITIVVFQHLLLPMTPEAVRNLIEAEPQATAEAETAALLTGRKLWEEPRFSPCVTHVHPQGFFRIGLFEVFLLKIIQDLRSYF